MIRAFQKTDLEAVAGIWLTVNQEAHDFISPQYWQAHFEEVKGMFAQAEIYIYEEAGGVQGFIGLSGNFIAGLFVAREAQSRGVGRQLVDFVKGVKGELSLRVYQKNERAVCFYRREAFAVQAESTDEDTGEREYVMVWRP